MRLEKLKQQVFWDRGSTQLLYVTTTCMNNARHNKINPTCFFHLLAFKIKFRCITKIPKMHVAQDAYHNLFAWSKNHVPHCQRWNQNEEIQNSITSINLLLRTRLYFADFTIFSNQPYWPEYILNQLLVLLASMLHLDETCWYHSKYKVQARNSIEHHQWTQQKIK
jgi:hypothetical protein